MFVFFQELTVITNMIMFLAGLSEAAWKLLRIVSTLRFLCSGCKGQMSQSAYKAALDYMEERFIYIPCFNEFLKANVIMRSLKYLRSNTCSARDPLRGCIL